MKEIGKIYLVNIDSLKESSFNPDRRTKKTPSLRKLIESMVSIGFLSFQPIIASEDGFIIDGHRRWTAAKAANITEVPVIYTHLSAAATFSLINGEQRKPLDGKQWVVAYSKGLPLEYIPESVAKHIRLLVDLCGNDSILYIVKMNLAPSNVVWLKSGLDYIAKHLPEVEIDQVFALKMLKWMGDKKQSYQLRVFVSTRTDYDSLMNAIRHGKDLKR